jgi:phosphoglycolate phosphatase-like HAD superfamily hydrolase
MRAKRVPYKAYIFDFDETLVKTDAKVHIIKAGKRIKSLTPIEFNHYVSQPGETLDLEDFVDPRIIMNAKKYKMWPALQNIDSARKMGRSSSDIYILTARSPRAQQAIHNFLTRNGIDIPLENVITVGTDSDESYDIAAEKGKVLQMLKDRYSDVFFYDDSPDNIALASKIGGIKTRLVD